MTPEAKVKKKVVDVIKRNDALMKSFDLSIEKKMGKYR
jgi:hypothetical protein